MTYKHILRLLLIAGLVLLDTQAAAPQLRKFYFRTLGCNLSLTDIQYSAVPIDEAKDSDPTLQVSESARSVFYPLSSKSNLYLYRLIIKADGKSSKELLATVDLSGTGPAPLLMFTPDKSSYAGWKVRVFDDDLKNFPPACLRIINTTPAEIHIALKSGITIVSADSQKLISFKDNSSTNAISIKMAAVRGENAMLIYTNNWIISPESRGLVFISVENGRPTVRRFIDSTTLLPSDHDKIAPLE